VAFGIIYGLRRYRKNFPAGLVALVVTTAALIFFELHETGIAIVGKNPRGLPSLHLPPFGFDIISSLLGPAVVISAVLLLFHPKEVFTLWKMNRHDGIVALTVFGLSLLPKPDYALLIGVVISLMFFLWKTMHPRVVRVSKDPELNMFINADSVTSITRTAKAPAPTGFFLNAPRSSKTCCRQVCLCFRFASLQQSW
jgi:MFS superfamily sulfate permease-like transporter